jgi:four helix bundle protein
MIVGLKDLRIVDFRIYNLRILINRQSSIINLKMDKRELILRTKQFAHDCVKLCVSLPNNYLSNHIKGQLIRSSTSVAANYRAACLGQSKASFISKLSIVIEESDESEFWLEFIEDEGLLSKDVVEVLRNEAHELASIFISSRMTASRD